MRQTAHHPPPLKNLVLVGGGHSHAIVLKQFALKPLPGVQITLITDVTHAPYSGMLPGYIAGFYEYDECHINLVNLAQFANADIVVDSVIGLNLEHNHVLCDSHPPIPFDVLSINIGSTPTRVSVPGAAEYTIAAKPVPEFLTGWNQVLTEWQMGIFQEKPLQIAIVGGGTGGVELAFNMQARLLGTEMVFKNISGLSGTSNSALKIHLFHSGTELMATHNPWVRRRVQHLLTQRGIQLHLGEAVCQIFPCETPPLFTLQCQSGLKIECHHIFWVTHAAAPTWLSAAGLDCTDNGFIRVNDYLQSTSHPHIFAAGDIATMIHYPREKAGVFAVRQGQPLFHNLQQILLGKPLKPFKPQKHFLSLIGTGNKRAIASRGTFAWESSFLWDWKDWIDHQFMAQFKTQ